MTDLAYEIVPCPVCGGRAFDTVADGDAIRGEVEALWEFHGSRLRPDTPPAHLLDRVAFSQHPPLQIVRCRDCGLVFRNPRERDYVLVDTYAGEAPDPDALARLFDTQLAAYRAQAERLGRVVGREGSVLEIGSYVGGFLAAATERGWQAEGVDVNATANAFARQRGLRVTEGTVADVSAARRFDVVAFWNCFDQLASPSEAAHDARERLRDGGWIVVRVPNGAFYAEVRQRLDGPNAELARQLLAHNNLLTFPYRHGFTIGSLARLLERNGFAIEHVYGDTLVPIADEWTQPWAAWEERAVKRALRELARDEADRAPWLEVYARATSPAPGELTRTLESHG